VKISAQVGVVGVTIRHYQAASMSIHSCGRYSTRKRSIEAAIRRLLYPPITQMTALGVAIRDWAICGFLHARSIWELEKSDLCDSVPGYRL
jgi:hypothetical protein